MHDFAWIFFIEFVFLLKQENKIKSVFIIHISHYMSTKVAKHPSFLMAANTQKILAGFWLKNLKY